MAFSRYIDAIRRADWLNGERGRVYSLMGVIAFAVMAVWILGRFMATPDGMGGDFLSFYAASKLALTGQAAHAWNPDIHAAAEHAALKGSGGYLAFFYPPPYLLVCWPLALLPYGWAALLWMVGTAALALFVLRVALRRTVPLIVLLAFPAVWINIGCGQNAALTLAILAAGFGLMDRRPVMAGLILGLMVIKPQLAILLPVVLGASQRWKTFVATGFSALALCAVAYVAIGNEGYAAFFANTTYAREVLNRGLVDPALMQSFYAALRVLGTPMRLAYAAQALLSLGVIGVAGVIAFRYRPDGLALGALAVSATAIATPFLLDYDLLITALPLGWLVMRGAKDGFRDWEKSLLLAAFLLPLVTRKLAQLAHLPIAPLILLTVFALVAHRLMATETAGKPFPVKALHAV
ncbi:MAG: glycosyltransferase family 87 protein [Asticcacaulis sp.]|uniref:glycosyltransferase family 87 protein n=1 Tax=Asticcacaulis sp. TaxID=1872648 RepID=UPI0039E3F346